MPDSVSNISVICDAYKVLQFQCHHPSLLLDLSQRSDGNVFTFFLMSLGQVPKRVSVDEEIVSAPVGYQPSGSIDLLEFLANSSVSALNVVAGNINLLK